MSKTKTVGGKDYRWDYKNKKWVESHGASGGEALGRWAKGVTSSVSSLFTKKPKKKDGLKTNTTKSTSKSNSKTPVSDHAKTGHTKLVKGPDGNVRRVKVSDTTKDKTLKGSDTSKTMKGKDQGDGGRADWLKKTRNSPAATSGAFTDEERWQQQLRHRAWKESRGKNKSTPKPTPKAKVKDKAKVTPKKKKKKQDLNFTTM